MPIKRNYLTLESLLLRPVPCSIFNEIPTVLFSSVPECLVSLPQRWGNWLVVYTKRDGLPNSVRRKAIGQCCSH